MQNVKAGKFAASASDMASSDYSEDNYSALNDVETVLNSVGITTRENATTWKSVEDILSSIADKWESMSDVTRSAVATAVAGTRQREQLFTIMSNWESVQNFSSMADNAYGTAAQKMEAYTDSIEAAKNRLSAAWEKLTLDVEFLSPVLSKFYDSLAWIVNNILPILTTGATLLFSGIKNEVLSFSPVISTIKNKLNDFISALDDSSQAIEEESNNRKENNDELKEENNKNKTNNNKWELGKKAGILGGGYIGATLGEAIAKTNGMDNSEATWLKTATTAGGTWLAKGVESAAGALGSLGKVGKEAAQAASKWSGIAGIIIGLLGAAQAGYNVAKNIKLNEVTDSFIETKNKFESLKSKSSAADIIDELSYGVNSLGENVALTEEEYTKFVQANNDLAEILPELSKTYDENGNAILNLNDICKTTEGGVISLADVISRTIGDLQEEADTKLTDSTLVKEALKENAETQSGYVTKQVKAIQEYKLAQIDAKNAERIINDKNASEEDIKSAQKELEKANRTISTYKSTAERYEQLSNQTSSDLSEKNAAWIRLYGGDLDSTQAAMALQILNTNKSSELNVFGKRKAMSADNYFEQQTSTILELTNFYATEQSKKFLDKLNEINAAQTVGEQESLKSEALNILQGLDSNILTDSVKSLLQNYGFDLNANSYNSTFNLLKQARGTNASNLTDSFLSGLSTQDGNTLLRWLGNNQITANTSAETISKMVRASRDIGFYDLSNQGEYIQQRINSHTALNDLFINPENTTNAPDLKSLMSIYKEWSDEDINNIFANQTEAVREGIKNIRDELNTTKGLDDTQFINELNSLSMLDLSSTAEALGSYANNIFNEYFTKDFDVSNITNAFEKIRDVIQGVADSYKILSDAQKDQVENGGKLSLKTTLDLLTANENYIDVLDITKDGISLKANAEEILARQQLEAVKATILEAKANNAQAGAALEARVAILAKALGENIEIKTHFQAIETEKQGLRVSDLANEGLGITVGVLNVIVEGLKAVVGLVKGQGLSGFSASAAFKMGKDAVSMASGSLGDKISQLGDNKELLSSIESIEQELIGALGKDALTYDENGKIIGIDMDKANEDSDYGRILKRDLSYDNLLSQIESIEDGDIGSFLTKEGFLEDESIDKLEKIKSLLGAINKEFVQMIAYGKGITGVLDTEQEMIDKYYNVQKKYLKMQMNEALSKGKSKFTEADMQSGKALDILYGISDKETFDTYMSYYEAYMDAYVKYQNLDDEQAQDNINILETAGVASQALVKQYQALYEAADTYEENIEYQVKLGEAQIKVWEHQNKELQTYIDLLDKAKPSEWGQHWSEDSLKGVDQISNYYDTLQKKYKEQQQLVYSQLYDKSGQIADTVANLTEEEVQTLMDEYNNLVKTISDTAKQELEDLKSYQESEFSALTEFINRKYIEQYNKQKDIVSELYDLEIDKLNDKNESIERTNKLIELQNNLLTAQQEKERVYKQGVGWVYQSNRVKQKEASTALEDFYRQDTIDDLTKAKEEELKVLDERIKNWQNYLDALEEQFKKAEYLKNEELVMELLGVDSIEAAMSILESDMTTFNQELDTLNATSATQLTNFFTGYSSAISTFFTEYSKTIKDIKELNTEISGDFMEKFILDDKVKKVTITYKIETSTETPEPQVIDVGSGSGSGSGQIYTQISLNREKVPELESTTTTYKEKVGEKEEKSYNGITESQAENKVEYAQKQVDFAYRFLTEREAYDARANSYGTGDEDKISEGVREYELSTAYWTAYDALHSYIRNNQNTIGVDDPDEYYDALYYYKTQLDNKEYAYKNFLATKESTKRAEANLKDAKKTLKDVQEKGTREAIYEEKVVVKENTQAIKDAQSKNEVIAANELAINTALADQQIRLTNDQKTELETFMTQYPTILSEQEASALATYFGEGGANTLSGLLTNTTSENNLLKDVVENLKTIADKLGLEVKTQSFTAASGNVYSMDVWEASQGSGGSDSAERIQYYKDEAQKLVDAGAKWTDPEVLAYHVLANEVREEMGISAEDINLDGTIKGSHASGLLSGPVTYTGLAMLHGSPSKPEYVLNSDQAYSILRYMATTSPDFTSNLSSEQGTYYNLSGDIVLNGVNDPEQFWSEVTSAMSRKFSTTKNRK